MKHIRINLDGDLKGAINQIEELAQKIEDFPSYVAEQATMECTRPKYSGHDITTTPEGEKNIGRVNAIGDQIGFVEYGTGIGAEYVEDAPVPTGWGTWSDSSINPEGKDILIKKGYWYYGGKKQYGEQATHGMTDTVEYLKQHTNDIAQRYFE